MYFNRFTAVLLASIAAPLAACQAATDNHAAATVESDALKAAIASPTRTADNVARDQYRHPYETLTFFGIEPDHMVVEISPGGGWYTEILAPYLRENGSLALVASDRGLNRAREKAANDAETYKSVLFSPIEGWAGETVFPVGSADAVLTFRNVHNWHMGGEAQEAFNAFFRMLKPGGTLGVVEHRLPEGRPDEDMKSSGYMKQSFVIAMAKAAGFELVEASEINGNPKDTADHPEGVWTLPPGLRLKDVDREKYVAIGESDRMTLKFRKPE